MSLAARRLLRRWLLHSPTVPLALPASSRCRLLHHHHHGNRRPLCQPKQPAVLRQPGQRGLAGSSALRLAARTAARLLKLRWLLAAGTASGGIAAANKYEEIKAGMPDLGRLRGFLPAEESVDAVAHALQRLSRFAQLPETGWLKNSVASLKSLVQRPSDASNKADGGAESSAAALDADAPTELAQQLEELEIRYQREAASLEAEARELRRQLAELRLGGPGRGSRSARKSLIDMYSEVLDALSERDAKFSAADHLPRVVVIGDQSSGKTSVLEAVARARLFPRGAGEMMTRAPVQVTLADGPYHVARFKDDPDREFDLTKESELAALRDAIERRMRAAVRSSGPDAAVSTEAIPLSVQGPGLPRMVLVDLPGIISTETAGMAAQTRESIRQLARQYMRNPNAIILCVADACVDPERSNAFDLVAKHDPAGRRTIFVLTKMDLAERDKVSPDRVAKLLAGRLLPLKALGYFAVVTGSGSQDESVEAIERHEAEYFASSRLFKDGRLSPSQVTAANMARAVSRRFWALVRESVEAQADSLKALRFNLETEWKHSFPGRRQCSRAELFEKARSDLLDEVIALSALPAERWEAAFRDSLSGPLLSQALDLLLEAESANSAPEARPELLQTRLDIGLRRWVESDLPGQCVAAGRSVLYQQFADLPAGAGGDPVLEPLCSAVRAEAAEAALRVLQSAALLDQGAEPGRADWDSAVALLRQALRHRLAETEAELARVCGPSGWQRWAKWLKAPTPEQDRLSRLVQALRTTAGSAGIPSASLSAADLAAARRSFASHRSTGEAAGAAVTDEELREAWPLVRRQMALRAGLANCDQCARMFYHYQQRLPTAAACAAVPYFHRVGRMLDATCSALRQQAVNIEARRLERAVGDALTGLAAEPGRLRESLRGRSVQLAEDIHSLRLAEEKLDRFIEALNSADDAIEGDRSGGTFADTGGGNEGFAFSKSRRRKTSL
uniref:Dynamin-like GTPase OPA1, mitochondrial n=1 Tax=Macrostomum lignano TaxID=282301 RepID=A0A1I8JAA9_9PLAT